MKKIVFALVILLFSGVFETEGRGRFTVSFNVFYTQLSPYGRWIELDDNLIVWKPARKFRGFKPYFSGRWIWTNYGWYWDSYEPFGNVVYHYGRWMYDYYYGWVWVPDYEWAPAWVEWCYDDDYIGWAPMRPLVTVNIRFNYSYHFDKYRYREYNFVRYRDFGSHRVQDKIFRERDNERYFNNARLRSEVTRDRDRILNNGIDRDFVRLRGASVDDESRIHITGRDARNADELVTKDRSVIRVKTISRDETEVREVKNINIEKRESRDGELIRDIDNTKDVRERVTTDEKKRDVSDFRMKETDSSPKWNERRIKESMENREVRDKKDVRENRNDSEVNLFDLLLGERKEETNQKREVRTETERKNNTVNRDRNTVNERKSEEKRETVNRDNSSERNREKQESKRRDNSSERKDDRERTPRKR